MRVPNPHRINPSYQFQRLVCRSALVLLTLSLLTNRFVAQSDKDVPELQLGKPIQRTLEGAQSHSYRISLASGQYVHVVVDQRGIDVVVTLLGPDVKKLTEVDSPNGVQGPEPVFAITTAAGTYRLNVRSLEKDAPAGQYEVKIEELRPATRQDESRIVAEGIFNEAESLYAEGSPESLRAALLKYDRTLGIFRALSNRRREAATLNAIGSTYSSLGDRRKALDYYLQALSLRRAVKDRQGEATTLNNLGLTYHRLGQTQKALGHLARALSLFRSLRDRGGEGITLNSIGLIYTSLGRMQLALNNYRRALPLFESVRDPYRTAVTFSNLGYVYNLTGDSQQALDTYSRAETIFKSEGDPRGQAIAQNGLGAAYFSLGETQKAIGYYSQALPVVEKVGEPDELASVLNNLALLYDSTGEKQRALDYYGRAQPIFHQIEDAENETTTLNNIGLIYSGLGDRRNADRYYNQALSLTRAVKNRRLEAYTLNNFGHLYDSSGDWQTALNYFKPALTLFRATGNRRGAATVLNNIGLIYRSLGDDWRALGYFTQAVDISHAIGARSEEAAALNNISVLYYRLNGVNARRRALDYARRSLLITREVGNRTGEAEALYSLAAIARDNGDLKESVGHIKAALEIINTLRSNIIRQELRSSYIATVQDYYEFYIDLLMRLHKERPLEGFADAALEASEGARGRGLLELLNEARADIRKGVKPELLERRRWLQQKLDAKEAARVRLLNGPYTAPQATAAAREIEELTTEYQEVEAKIRQSSAGYAALTQPASLSLKAIQEELDQDTLLLEYSLGRERSYLWLVSKTEISSFELPGRVVVERGARSFYESLNQTRDIYDEADHERTPASAGRQQKTEETLAGLSRMLLGPVTSQLLNKRLVIVADGALQYIPFGALSDPTTLDRGDGGMQPLIMKHEVLNLPSVSILATMRSELAGRKPAPRDFAVLADPVFSADDDRVDKNASGRKASDQNPSSVATDDSREQAEMLVDGSAAPRDRNRLVRLKATRKEAQKVLEFVPADSALSAFDFDASRDVAVSDKLSQYRYILFATHGQLDSAHPELSALIFSLVDKNGNPQDGYLRAHDIYNLKLPAEVVVLSGCQTGLGPVIRGEGLIGLTRGFMYAGSAWVVASLWNVDDEATAELVALFYRGMFKEGKRPAEALRMAQIEISRQAKWHSPHYWAAFVLQGEWK